MIGSLLNFASLRRSEWICLAFFACVAILSFFIAVPARRRLRLVTLSAAVTAVLLFLPAALSSSPGLLVSVIRDWLPAPLILLGYHAAGRLTFPRPDQSVEKALLRWDEFFFGLPLLRILSSNYKLPGWLDAALEFSYLQCYVIVPSGIAVLYLAHQRALADDYWSVVLPAVFAAYGLTPLFPAQPPRKLPQNSPSLGEPSPLRMFNLWIHDHASIKFNTFPSGHVAGAVSASLALMQPMPIAGACYMAVAAGIMFGSVRGRYHYAADAVLGVVVAAAACLAYALF
ncbi:MAG: phosphatase PAP2 family protein [Acidobacteriota bacterium]